MQASLRVLHWKAHTNSSSLPYLAQGNEKPGTARAVQMSLSRPAFLDLLQSIQPLVSE